MAPAAPAEPTGDYRERFEALTGRSMRQCPHCHAGTMVVIDSIMAGYRSKAAKTALSPFI